MRLRIRSGFITSFVVAAVAVSGIVTTAAPAQALPTCDAYSEVRDSAGRVTNMPSVGFYTSNINCVMAQGAHSEGVRILQISLTRCFRPLGTDGIYGTQTRQAVFDVQRQHPIGRDGVYGPQTRDHMRWSFWDGNHFVCLQRR
jgi:peptidoglycan hydrolase-like protein with peptidoglycan-binding domain